MTSGNDLSDGSIKSSEFARKYHSTVMKVLPTRII